VEKEHQVQARVIFSGMVQGVGFRYTTLHAAPNYDVAGYVRNCVDGSVELLAEGQREEVEAFIDAVSVRMARYIRDRDIRWAPATGEFRGFGISYGWD